MVIDIDPQCNTTSVLLPKNTQVEKSLFDILEPGNEIDLNESIYRTKIKNVSIIPNLSDTGNLEPDLIKLAPKSFFNLRTAIRKPLTKSYDVTIIDCPPNMGTFVLCALFASDFVIVPIKAGSAFSVEGLIKATKLNRKKSKVF